jgi:hypothetical protein
MFITTRSLDMETLLDGQSIERLKSDNRAGPAFVLERKVLLREGRHRMPGLILHLNIEPDDSPVGIVHWSWRIVIEHLAV